MILTSRELATVVWFAILVAFALSVKEVRSSVRSMLAILFSPKMLVLITLIITYNIAVVWWLWGVGYWDATMLYDTVVFVAVGGIGSVSRAASPGITYDGRFFFKTILMNLEVMVVFVFLSDFFSFNFWVEFLFVIPFLTMLVMLIAVAEHQRDATQVHRFLIGVQAFIGLFLLGYVVWQVAKNYGQLIHAQVLYSLGLPLVMSVFFVPVLFLVCALFAYEDAFLVVQFRSRSDTQFARWKKRRLVLRFGLNLKALQVFRRSMAIQEFGWAKTKGEAQDCLKTWPGIAANHRES